MEQPAVPQQEERTQEPSVREESMPPTEPEEERNVPHGEDGPIWEEVDFSNIFFTNLLAQGINMKNCPSHYKDIAKFSEEDKKEWYKAMDDEMNSLRDRKVWDLVDLPKGRKTVKGRWVFVVKSDGRKKARFVAKGFTQIYGLDFEDTFSPVAETTKLTQELAVKLEQGETFVSGTQWQTEK